MSDSHPSVMFWRDRYRTGTTPWDLGAVSEPARLLFQRWFPPTGAVFVPGCGRGYEALYLAARGYAVTALDLVSEPLDWLRAEAARRGIALEIRQGDLLAPSATDDGRFDVVLEQTCLCALHPRNHAGYEAAMHRVLKPGGQLLAVFMEVPGDGGPPYSLPPERAFALFPAARWEHEGPFPAPQNPARPGPEYLARFVRKASR